MGKDVKGILIFSILFLFLSLLRPSVVSHEGVVLPPLSSVDIFGVTALTALGTVKGTPCPLLLHTGLGRGGSRGGEADMPGSTLIQA